MIAAAKNGLGAAVSEVGVTASEQRTENDHAVNVAGARAVNRVQMREKAHLDILNLGLGQASQNDVSHLLGSRMYSNQDLSIIANRHIASRKNMQCSSMGEAAKNAGLCVVAALIMCVGPILSALGWLRG